MDRIQIRRAAVLLIVLFSCLPLTFANTSEDSVRDELTQQNAWLGDGENGDRWRAYLHNSDLEAELAKGAKADPTVVAAALEQYTSGAKGLDLPKFAAVRTALTEWLEILSLPKIGELPQIARAGKQQFQPIDDQQVAAAKAELLASVAALDTYLKSGGKNGAAWKKYLKWDELQAQLTDDAKPNWRTLNQVYNRLRANHTGLEMPVFSNVADGIQHYYDLASINANSEAEQQFAKQLDELANNLEKYAQTPDEPTNLAVGRTVGYLESSGQTPQLVESVRRHYSHPNLWARVSEEFLDTGMSRMVDDTTDVSDVILGTRITGKGKILGQVNVQLVPSTEHAHLKSTLAGRVTSDTVGRNGPVFIYNDGLTRFNATKAITIDAEGMHTKPAACKATTQTTTRGISTTRDGRVGERMIRKIAWNRIGQQRGQANRIAGNRAARRVEDRFDREADQQVQKTNTNFQEKFRGPLLRKGEFPRMLRFRTTDDHLYVKGLQANRYQLGSPTVPPQPNGNHDVSLVVHETLINNLAAATIAGKTFTDEDMEEIGKELGGEWEEKLRRADDEDPWSITYAVSRPVTVTFGDNGFTATLRGRRYTSGDREFQAMNVTAKYKMEKTDTGAKLIRQGELEIFPPGFDRENGKLSTSQVALRRLLNKRMNKMFPPEIDVESKELPDEWAKVGKLRLDELVAGSGWLTLGWSAPNVGQLAEQAFTISQE